MNGSVSSFSLILGAFSILLPSISPAGSATNRIMVMIQQDQPLELASDIAGHIGKSYRCAAESAALRGPTPESPAAASGAAGAQRDLCDRVVVLLVDRPNDNWTNAMVVASNRVAIVNMAAYRDGIKAEPESQELYRRRLEREAVRMVSLALGMKPCPFPLCGISESRTMADLDARARNLCPHCQMLSEAALKKAGLAIAEIVLTPGKESRTGRPPE